MEQFRSELGCDPPLGGAPDNGNGHFADRLSYKDWVMFNKSVRVHNNMHESITVYCFLPLAGILWQPLIGVICVTVILVSKVTMNVLARRTNKKC